MKTKMVANRITDPERNIVVVFLAYRTMTPAELLRNLSVMYATRKVKNNRNYRVKTSIGASGR